MPSVAHSAARYASKCFRCLFMLSPWRKQTGPLGFVRWPSFRTRPYTDLIAVAAWMSTRVGQSFGSRSSSAGDHGRLFSCNVKGFTGLRPKHPATKKGPTKQNARVLSMSDEHLFAEFIRRIRAGDEEAAAQLVRQFDRVIR